MLPATGVVIDGQRLLVPGVTVRNYLDDPALKLSAEDGAPRTHDDVTCVVLHSTLGAPDRTFPHPQTVLPGRGPSTDAGRQLVRAWGSDHRCAGAALAVDHDATVYNLCDLRRWVSWHATTVNYRSVGIEFRQGRAQSEFYTEQFHAGRVLVDWLTAYFPNVQRMVPKGYRNRPCRRLAEGAKDFFGVFGHRDQSNDRGEGDPGDALMAELATAGYEQFDVDAGEDLEVWRARQRWLGVAPANQDGVPGAATRARLLDRGFGAGLWALPPRGLSIPAALRPAA